MADEVSLRFALNVLRNSFNIDYRYPSTEFVSDLIGTIVLDHIQIIGTAAENVYVGDAGAGCRVIAINLDDTNYVQLGQDSGGFVPDQDVLHNDIGGPKRLPSGYTLQAKANTASCKIRFIILAA